MGIQARNPHEEDEEIQQDESGEPIDPALDDDPEPVALREIDHIGIVVPDLDDAIAEHRELYGIVVDHREEWHDEEAEVAFLTVGGSAIQLISPTSDESAFAEFLEDGGAGLHHVAYRVDDVATALAALAAQGCELIDDAPRPGPRSSKVAFVHPDSAFGVLVQLVER